MRRLVVFVILLKQFRASLLEYGRAVSVLFCNCDWGLDGLGVGFVLWKVSGVFGPSFEGAHGMLEGELLLPLAGRPLERGEGILGFGWQRVVLERLLAGCLFWCWKNFLVVVHLWEYQIWHDGFGHMPSFRAANKLNMRSAPSSKLPTTLGLDGAHFGHLMPVLVQSIPETTAHELVAHDVMGHSKVSQRLAFALLLLLLIVCLWMIILILVTI